MSNSEQTNSPQGGVIWFLESGMPTYFFKTAYNNETHETHGMDLPDDEAAWTEATVACGQIIRDLDGRLLTQGEWRMEVRRSDEPLYRLRLLPEKLQ